MASVIKRRKSPYWVACYSLPNGTRLQRSTRTKDKSIALQIAITAENAARKKITSDAARSLISELVELIHGTTVSHQSCKEYFDSWMLRRSNEVAHSTVARYKEVTGSLKDFLGKAWLGPLSDLTAGHIAEWRNSLSEKYAAITVNIYLKITKQALKDAWQEGLLSESPAEKIKLMRVKEGSEKQTFTTEQYRKLLAHADDEWLGMIHFGAFTGQRLSDIASARLEDIDRDWWRFVSRKTGSNMAIPLAAPVQDWMKRYLASRKSDSEYLFPASQAIVERTKGKVGTLSNQFYVIMTNAGLVPPRSHHDSSKSGRSGRRTQSGLSFHSFRHTCTTWLKAQGVSESVAMAFIGHESKAVNRSYTHLPESTLQDAMRKIESFSLAA